MKIKSHLLEELFLLFVDLFFPKAAEHVLIPVDAIRELSVDDGWRQDC